MAVDTSTPSRRARENAAVVRFVALSRRPTVRLCQRVSSSSRTSTTPICRRSSPDGAERRSSTVRPIDRSGLSFVLHV